MYDNLCRGGLALAVKLIWDTHRRHGMPTNAGQAMYRRLGNACGKVSDLVREGVSQHISRMPLPRQ